MGPGAKRLKSRGIRAGNRGRAPLMPRRTAREGGISLPRNWTAWGPGTNPVSVSSTDMRAGRGRAPMNVRHAELLELVRQRGFVSIDSMAARFPVSNQTIRRDIQHLSDLKLLERLHGGAGLPPGTDTLAYTNRQVHNARQKRQIGKLVAREIPNGASIFIDIEKLLFLPHGL